MKEIRMGLERSRRPILNLQSFRGSETVLRGSNILPEFAIFPLRFYERVRGVVFRPCVCNTSPTSGGPL